jgi:hypothetical protein
LRLHFILERRGLSFEIERDVEQTLGKRRVVHNGNSATPFGAGAQKAGKLLAV